MPGGGGFAYGLHEGRQAAQNPEQWNHELAQLIERNDDRQLALMISDADSKNARKFLWQTHPWRRNGIVRRVYRMGKHLDIMEADFVEVYASEIA